MPMTLANGDVLLDAFPFDSNKELITDVNGYRRGDRSVDAWTMRNTFRQFFSTGVFGTPANALQISKADSGLAVTVQPGMCVIEGGMGGVEERNGPLTVTLDSGAAAGNVCYGVFLRFDNNADTRGIVVQVRKGTAGADPQPPAPDTTSEGVYELRLGYVPVPNGATDLTNATVTNEKGLAVCPYAAPFVPLDLDSIVADARAGATEALRSLLAYFETYRDAIDAALDDSAVTYLQQQITALQEQIGNTDLSGQVDGTTIEYETKLPTFPSPVLQVKLDQPGSAASSANVQSVAGDLATIAYEFHRDQLDGMDLDSIVTFEFPDDVQTSAGVWDAGGSRYYANAGTGE